MNNFNSFQLVVDAINLCDNLDDTGRPHLLELTKALHSPKEFERLTRVNEYESALHWRSTLERLLEESQLSDEQMWIYVSQVRADIIRMHAILHLVEYTIRRGKMEAAMLYTEQLAQIKCGRTNDNRTLGFRKILRHYATEGDLERFLDLLKKCEPGKERYDIDRCKYEVMGAYALKSSLDEVLRVCRSKPFGEKYYVAALIPLCKIRTFAEMKRILDEHPALDVPALFVRETILAKVFSQNVRRYFDAAEFKEIFELVDKVDPKKKAGDLTLRDALLMTIGMNCEDLPSVVRCRKAIKSARTKAELRFVEKTLGGK